MVFCLILTLLFQSPQPTVRYDKSGRLVAVENLQGDSEPTCKKFTVHGSVTYVDHGTKSTFPAFNVKARGRQSIRFTLSGIEDLNPSDQWQLFRLLQRGSRVSATGYGCGISAAVIEADDITLVSPPR